MSLTDKAKLAYDVLKQEGKNAISDIGNSYQDILLQSSPVEYREAEHWQPESGLEPVNPSENIGLPVESPLSGETLEPYNDSKDYQKLEGMVLDGDYTVIGDKNELLPPSLPELPAPDDLLGLDSLER